METAQSSLADSVAPKESSVIRNTPRMSSRTLTILLALMCTVPGITIYVLWQIMPPVSVGTLNVTVERLDVPGIEYYQEPIEDRYDVSGSKVLIRNDSEHAWSHIVIKLNNHYDIKDSCTCELGCELGKCTHGNNPIEPGEERSYLLNRFVGRTSAKFDLRQLPLRHVRVFAKQIGKGNRASFDADYPEMTLQREGWFSWLAY